MEQKYYSQFWLDYAEDRIELDPEFAWNDIKEDFESDANIISGRVRVNRNQFEYVEYKNCAVCDIQGRPIS